MSVQRDEHGSGGLAQDKRDWIVLAFMGGQIDAPDAAARLSAVDRAERDGRPIPDIRDEARRPNSWDWDAADRMGRAIG